MRKLSLKIVTMTLCMMMLFTLTTKNTNAKTASGYYYTDTSVCTTFKKKGRKLYVKNVKGRSIEYYKTNNINRMKKVGRYKVFKVSKKCKYYLTSVSSDERRLFDSTYTRRIKYKKITSTIKDIRKSGEWNCGLIVVVKKGYVTKIMMIYS